MNKYETIYILNPELDQEGRAALNEKFKALIEANGEFEGANEWGKRKLAYPINKTSEGFYVLVDFSAKADFISELERVYKITDGVLKHIVINKEK